MDLSVIILNYNTRELLKKCLQSVFDSQTNYRFEVLVSDNGSTDGSAQMVINDFPKAKLIQNKKNLGFSKGNNVAIKQAQGRLVLLLNSDTTVRPNAFNLSIKYMDEHADVGCMGCKVLLPDGNLDKACRRKFPNPANAFLRLFGFKKFSDYNLSGDINQETEVDSVMGAYMVVSKNVIGKVGMLDEEFFMYGEDLDWCWRIKEAGYKVMYYPNVEITHYKYGSAQAIPFKTIGLAHEAMKIFYRKHYARQYNLLFNLLVYAGIELRKYLVLTANLLRTKKTVH